MAHKRRVDHAVVEAGLAESRAKAQALIMSGNVLVNDVPVSKAGTMIAGDAQLRVRGKGHSWVSRGGQKLAHAFDRFSLDIHDAHAIDVGASTGGFTDVLLHHGAACVYAVDVGHGQLDWKLRNDTRVVVMEKTNARYLSAEYIGRPVQAVVCDASFISIKTVLPAALALTDDSAWCCALIKPQFEAGREHVGKGGVIRDAAVHAMVCNAMRDWVATTLDAWELVDIIDSPITGPKGNKEFLLYMRRA